MIDTVTGSLSIDLALPVPVVRPEPGDDRIDLHFEYDGLDLGAIILPAPDGRILPGVLRDATAARFAWRILGRYLDRTWYPGLTLEAEAQGTRVLDGDDVVASLPAPPSALRSAGALHDLLGWKRLINSLFAHVQNAHDPASRPRVLPAAAEPFQVELTAPVAALHAPEPGRWIAGMLAGRLASLVWLEHSGGPVAGATLHQRLVEQAGFEICVIAARAGLIGRGVGRPGTRRWLVSPPSRGGAASRDGGSAIRAMLGDFASRPGLLLERRGGVVHGDARRRRVVFPADNGIVLAESATLAREPVRLTARTASPEWVAYVPECTGPMQPLVQTSVPEGFTPGHRQTVSLPILMYHRIAADGAPATSRYRVAPDQFERQLDWLRANQFRSVGFDEWRAAAAARQPLPGRACIITFDDAYEDFGDIAWPLLRRYGFNATLFVPTGFVGRSNDWDAETGDVVRLLGWQQLRALHADGVALGAHTVNHRDLTRLPITGIVEELARSRVALIDNTGAVPAAIAYPYGISDDVVMHYAGGCGYTFGLTTVPRRALLHDSLLGLPRIEVAGDAGLDDFVQAVGPTA